MDNEGQDLPRAEPKKREPPSYKRIIGGAVAAVALLGGVWGFIGAPTPWEIGSKVFSAEIAALSIDVEPNPDLQIESPPTVYVIPREIERVGPPPAAKQQGAGSPAAESCSGRYEWAHTIGAADFLESNAEVTLTGNSATTVVVTGQVHVERKPAFDGPILSCLGLGSGLVPQTICVDLVRERLSSCAEGADPRKPFARQLTSGEAEVLHLRAAANPPIAETQGPIGVYEWTVDLDVSVNGEHQHHVIDDDGQPFRTYVTDRFEKTERDYYVWLDGQWQRPRGF